VPDLMDGWIFQPGYPLVTAELTDRNELQLTQQRFTYLPSQSTQTWHIPVQLRVSTDKTDETKRLLLTEATATIPLGLDTQTVVINEGGHGFYRVRYGPALLRRLLEGGLGRLAPVERFNLINDAWATTVAGLMPLAEYLDLTARFTGDLDKNVWVTLIDSFSFLNRIIEPDDRPMLEAFVRRIVGPALAQLGWTPQARESELTKQLRGELIGALGRLGNDQETQDQVATLYKQMKEGMETVDPNLAPALVSIMAFTGDVDRYEEFIEQFKKAKTPQEERRYLFSLAAFRQPELLEKTLRMTLNGEIRVQDAPFIVNAVMVSVYGREQGWHFVKSNWDQMDNRFPKQGLRRMCGGIVGLATAEFERDVQDFFASRKIDLGGKTMEQYLEQLRIAVAFRKYNGNELRRYLPKNN